MKKIRFSRQSIQRAIRIACVTLFLAAASLARAQTATGDGNGNVTISGSGHNFVYMGTNPTLAAGGTLTVSSGSAITNTNSGYIIDLSEAATITNNGTLSVRDASGVGDFAAAITSTGGAQATTINNLGTASANIAGSGTTAAAIYADSTTGAISVSNLGMIYAQAHSVANGIDGISSSGAITIANAGSVSASASGDYVTATGISATTSGDIKISSIGSGSIVADGTRNLAYGINANSSGGDVRINNAATISASGYYNALGINATAAGSIAINNGGAISAISTGHGGEAEVASPGFGIYAASTGGVGDISIANTGDVTAFCANSNPVSPYSTTAAAVYGSSIGSTGNVLITNTGAIKAVDSASGYLTRVWGIEAESTNGNCTILNNGSKAITVFGDGLTTGLGSGSVYGSASVTNSSTGTISVSSSVHGAYEITGIQANSFQGLASITNSGTVSVSGGSASDLYASGASSTNIVNQGTLLATSSGERGAIGINAVSYQTGDVSILNGGAIIIDGNGINRGIFCQAYQNSASIINTGSISVPVGTGIGAYASFSTYSPGLTIVNTGAITAGECIFGEAGIAIITNSGRLTSSGYSSIGIAIGTYTDCTLTNSSSGTISVTSTHQYDYADGIGSTVFYGSSAVSNAASITATAKSGSAYCIQSVSVYGYGGESYTIAIQNSGALTSTGGAAGCIIATSEYGDTSGSFSVQNTGALTSQGNDGSANGLFVSGGGQTTVTNTGMIHTSASGYFGSATDIAANGSAVAVTNGGGLTAISGSDYGTAIEAASDNTTSVTNCGTLLVVGSREASGLSAYGMDDMVVNTAAISALSRAGNSVGISVVANGGEGSVANSGTITCHGDTSSGIYATGSAYSSGSLGWNVILNNTGAVTVSASHGNANGLVALSNGNLTLNNSAHVVATSYGRGSTANGIMAGGLYSYIDLNSDTVSITNSGYTGGFDTDKGYGYGIEAGTYQIITISNTGTARGTTSGIYLATAGTVNNSGLASGGKYSIEVPTGSTVNLNDYGAVQGLMKGGSDDTSTSDLNFNLKVRGNLSAAQTSLNAAIAQYDAAYTAANGNGANVDSEVVTINGVAYKWEDFGGITDALVQGRVYGNTPGYQAIGSTVDRFNPLSARGASVLNALDSLPDTTPTGALAQLSPQSLQVLRHIAFDDADFTAQNVNNHLTNLRDGLTGFDTSGFTENSPGVDPTLTQMKSRLLAWNPAPYDHGLLSDSSAPFLGGTDTKDTKSMVNPPTVDRWSAFISGSVVLANLDNTLSNTGDSNYTTGSVLAGADYRLGEHLTVGVLFDYAHSSADLDGNGSKATVDSYAPGIYASYVDKGWYGNATALYGFNSDTENRQITLPGIAGINHGASDGGQVTSNLTGGYEFQRDDFKFGPVASLQYAHLTVGSFQEEGPTSLSISRQEDDSLRTQLGFEVRYSARVAMGSALLDLTPHFQATWQHEYMDNSDGITSQFNGGTGGGSFVVQGEQPERDAAFLDLGLDTQVTSNVTLFVDYQNQAGQKNFSAQSAQGGVRVGF